MKRSMQVCVCVSLWSAPLGARAQEGLLTLEGALQRAREQAGPVVSGRFRIEEARARADGARVLRDNPVLESAVGDRSGGPSSSADLELGLSQTFELGEARRPHRDRRRGTRARDREGGRGACPGPARGGAAVPARGGGHRTRAAGGGLRAPRGGRSTDRDAAPFGGRRGRSRREPRGGRPRALPVRAALRASGRRPGAGRAAGPAGPPAGRAPRSVGRPASPTGRRDRRAPGVRGRSPGHRGGRCRAAGGGG